MFIGLIMASVIQAQPVTYTKTVRPIMEQRCFVCHGGKIPSLPDFSTYEGTYEKRDRIKVRVFDQRTMPPGGGGMTDAERKLIKAWVDQGAKK